MGISRGFRRLSFLAGFAGAIVIVCLWLSTGTPTVSEFVLALLLFVSVPAVFVLILGWVVAGFRNP
jgi:hypothetical protein